MIIFGRPLFNSLTTRICALFSLYELSRRSRNPGRQIFWYLLSRTSPDRLFIHEDVWPTTNSEITIPVNHSG